MWFVANNNLWKIEFVDSSADVLLRGDGSRSVAVTDNVSKTVSVSNAIDGDFLRKVICHELTHVFMFEYNIFIKLEAEEFICDFVATYGTDIINLTDNIFNVIRRL